MSMMNSEYEIQYVALRTLRLLLMNEKYMRKTLNIKSFFVKYNDPIYIKLEKLEVIALLADEDNIESVL